MPSEGISGPTKTIYALQKCTLKSINAYKQTHGGSRISQTGEGRQPLNLGQKLIIRQDFCRKLHEHEINCTERGRVSLVPPLRSADGFGIRVHHCSEEIWLLGIGGSKGAPGTRAPPLGPSSFIFMQFLAKKIVK